MAKHVIQELYTYTPSTKTLVITNKWLRQEQLLLITNTTRNTVLYNFSDPTLTATSYTNSLVNNVPTTTITFSYNTASHSTTDKISILVEEINETFQASELLTDPVGKFRTSTPQALIDTDFEYSTQSTKWESLTMINNRPYGYYNVYNQLTFTDIQAVNGSRTITVATTTPPTVGTPVYIQDTYFSGAEGLFQVDTVSAGTNFTYTARNTFTGTTGSIYNAATPSTIYQGYVFSNASIGAAGTATFTPGTNNAITVVTAIPHGLLVGNEIAVSGITGTNPPNGSWIVATVTSPTSFVYYTTLTASGLTVSSALLYVRPQGTSIHRPYDGGVFFSTNASSHNQQQIRQTRRYFRYQSGKGIQMSTGTILKPSLLLDQISSAGTTVTVTSKLQHNVSPGVAIIVSGATETAYNGTFTVASVINSYQFTYTAASTPSATPASGLPIVSVSNWYGASTRVGMFDQQNGIFFEYDGQTLWAVRRSSTYQINGWATATNGSSTITGVAVNGVSPTFSKQLVPGDYIVIKGMSYRVLNIASDTSMTVSPAYRGVTGAQVTITKTVDTKTPQSAWNLDRFDGTGTSGFNLDLTKMQMFYLDYSWYGAGTIRWGFRTIDGSVAYGMKMANNNVNDRAYMRSGNLPGRYETNTFTPSTLITANILSGDSTVNVVSTSGFPSTGTALIRSTTAFEYVNYTGITATSLTGCTRGQAGVAVSSTTVSGSPVVTISNTSGIQVGQLVIGTGIQAGAVVVSIINNVSVTLSIAAFTSATNTLVFAPMANTAQAFTYSATAPITVELHSPSFASTISHWGTSVIMDGRFDDDKSYVFTRGMTTALSIAASPANNALMSIRIAPSVSNGVGASTLGSRELINRMQLVLRQMDIFSNGQFLITLVLNGTVSSATPNWTNSGGSSLAQVILHSATTTITGGETIFGFFINTSGGTNYSVTQQDLSLVRDLGTSILSGGAASAITNVYPDGPDIITVMAQNLSASAGNISARLSWTEAQA
jgi:hypothetical protein